MISENNILKVVKVDLATIPRNFHQTFESHLATISKQTRLVLKIPTSINEPARGNYWYNPAT